jgi:hypothetical protein
MYVIFDQSSLSDHNVAQLGAAAPTQLSFGPIYLGTGSKPRVLKVSSGALHFTRLGKHLDWPSDSLVFGTAPHVVSC